MLYDLPYRARQLDESANRNQFLAALPAKDFSLLAPHLRSVQLERGAILHDVGDEIEEVYFPQKGMASLVTVMRSGTTVLAAAVGRAGVSAPRSDLAPAAHSEGPSLRSPAMLCAWRVLSSMPRSRRAIRCARLSLNTTIFC